MASIKTYISESYNELVHKVSWPTWKELQNSSILVLVAAIIVSLIIFLMDYIFGVQDVAGNSFWKGILGYIYKFIS